MSAGRRFVVSLALAAAVAPASARAERWVEAFDPARQVKPSMMIGDDGRPGRLLVDADFRLRAERYRRTNPGLVRQTGAAGLVGEVLVLEGDADTIETDGSGYAIRALSAVARKAIARLGDHFQQLTVWTTFEDRSNRAAAYEFTVKNDVRGIGVSLTDRSADFGSAGVLRSVVSMESLGLAEGATPAAWEPILSIWGQESAHRWMIFMQIRDPRTGRNTNALLGRDCAHYNMYVDAQASVLDGFAWQDNGDGSFTWTAQNRGFAALDLYGMGILRPEEVPPFYAIVDVPGFDYPPCGAAYEAFPKATGRTITGRRLDFSIDDVVAANGERIPGADERPQDYLRELQVVLTRPTETLDTQGVRLLAQRIDRARLWWQDWVRSASGQRLVICTQATADCGDPRSDVEAIAVDARGRAPAAGLTPVTVTVANRGGAPATGVRLDLAIDGDGGARSVGRDLGTVAPGAAASAVFELELRDRACGDSLMVVATTQSDFHRARRAESFLLGTESVWRDDFEEERGWLIDPDATDDAAGGRWERGTPAESFVLGERIQRAGAYGGVGAFVTGAAAEAGGEPSYVTRGKSTLESPVVSTAGRRDLHLAYRVSFVGVGSDPTGTRLVPGPESRLAVLARRIGAADDGAADAAPGAWVAIDELAGANTRGFARRFAALPAEAMGGGAVQIRFVASEAGARPGAVEVVIDDVELLAHVDGCYADASAPPPPAAGGCGCRLGIGGAARGDSGAAPLVWLAAGLAWAGLRRGGRRR